MMWEKDHLRPLSWAEYVDWQDRALPFGWLIVRAPEEGAQILENVAISTEPMRQKGDSMIIAKLLSKLPAGICFRCILAWGGWCEHCHHCKCCR